MLQDFDFDFSGFEDVPPPQPRATHRLPFTEEDRLSQNDSFHRVLQGACAFRLQLSPDGRFIRLDPKGPHNLTFSKAGIRTHHPLGDMLRRKGMEPPLSYVLCWREDLDCWVGQYDGLAAPAPVPVPQRGRRRKTAPEE